MKNIFVDFFDTVCFRHIHSHQVFLQWAKVIRAKFPNIAETYTAEQLVVERNNVINRLGKEYEEPPYKNVMGELYKELKPCMGTCSEEDFISASKEMDIAVELGCQYPNMKLIKYLWKCKKTGSKIYIVSDFYLPQDCYQVFLRHMNIESLFEGIYVSETYNKTKRKGTLYDFVLKQLGADPAECLMKNGERLSQMALTAIEKSKSYSIDKVYKQWMKVMNVMLNEAN